MQIRCCVIEKKKPIRDPTQKKKFPLIANYRIDKTAKPNVKKEDSLGSSLT